MYTITVLARKFGLSRSTLLYYDRIKLLSPCAKSAAGYRLYDDQSVRRLELICSYKKAGLSLAQIRKMLGCVKGLDAQIIQSRILSLDREVENIRVQQKVLCQMLEKNGQQSPRQEFGKEHWVKIMKTSGMQDADLRRWHEAFERHAPQAHHDFLRWLGINEREAVEIRNLTYSVEDNTMMMKYFNTVFRNIPRQGPGSDEATLRAWETVKKVLGKNPVTADIGCGSGSSALCLAKQGITNITAVDNDPVQLETLAKKAKQLELAKGIKICQASMFDLPFDDGSLDLIWSEGAIFIIGFEQGLIGWKKFLRPEGILAVSEMCWFTDKPEKPIKDYFDKVYPALTTQENCVEMARRSGYRLLEKFVFPYEYWVENYYIPMEAELDRLEKSHPGVKEVEQLVETLKTEIKMYKQYSSQYGYAFYIFQSV